MSERFLFPFEKINYGSKIVLYGAGVCGQAFYQQIQASKYCEIVIWLDKNADEARYKYGVPAYMPKYIENVVYDFVVVGISNEKVAIDVAKYLSSEYQVPAEKIITTVIDLEQYQLNYSWGEYTFIGEEKNRELEKIAPYELVKSERLDIAVRWLLCRDFVSGIVNDNHKSLYTRMQLARIGTTANSDFWTENPKKSVQDMLKECKKLCLSMQKSGFQKEKAIPLSSRNHMIIDGSHRLATALALEKEIWVKYFGNVSGGQNYGFKWFLENGFNTSDLISILRAYCEISSKQLGMVVLYGTVIEQWEYLQKQIGNYFLEVGWFDLDFTGNFYGFEELIREIYYDEAFKNPYNDFKLKFLEKAPLKIRVIVLEKSEKVNYKNSFYAELKSLKANIRNTMYFETGDAPCVMHSSDDLQEFHVLKSILLSVNNLNYLKHRVVTIYSNRLLERLEKAKNELNKIGIPIKDCAIAGGSVMEILGLYPSSDLDILVHSRWKDKFSKETYTIFDDDIEFYVQNRICVGGTALNISNDVLIDNDEFHFIFAGWKIMNLEIYKSYLNAYINNEEINYNWEKQNEKLRKIELFEEFCLYFDDKSALRNQIKQEYFRKRFS